MEFSIDKYFSLYLSNARGGYNSLLEIEYFLKLEDSLEDKIKTREQKILYFYINNYERDCTNPDCPLKQFLNLQLSIENFSDMNTLVGYGRGYFIMLSLKLFLLP